MHDRSNVASGCFAVTKSDSTELPQSCCGLYVGGTGDVVVKTESGLTVTFSAVPAGTILPVAVRRVMNATTATLITGSL